MRGLSISLFMGLLLVACGPTPRGNGDDTGGGDDQSQVDAPPGGPCVPTAEVCNDAVDNDCDGRADCSDNDCSGVGSCPVCGQVERPEGQPLALPDGISSGTSCSTNASCGATTPNCVVSECHASYTSTLNFVGFPQGARLDDPNKLLSVCMTIEHSWLRDLQMDLISPDGRILTLHQFVDRTGGEIYLGVANDADAGSNPVAGTGWQYCWKPTALKTMLETTPTSNAGHSTMPMGDYRSFTPWSSMQGTQLNGMWTLRVTDLWSIDNGFMFKWSIAFDPSLVVDCSGPIIL